MYDELIKALRGCVLSKPCELCPFYDPHGPSEKCTAMNFAAADSIEELSRRAAEWEVIAESWQKACKGLESRIPRWIPVTERLS